MSADAATHVTFACPACTRTIRVSSSRVGSRGACPGCGEPVMVPGTPPDGTEFPGGAFDPEKTQHIPTRVPFYADRIARRQRRLGQYVTREEAHAFVLRLFHEHVLQVGTLLVICLVVLTAVSVLTDGFMGALVALGKQLLWIAPVAAVMYVAGRFLLVPPAPKR